MRMLPLLYIITQNGLSLLNNKMKCDLLWHVVNAHRGSSHTLNTTECAFKEDGLSWKRCVTIGTTHEVGITVWLSSLNSVVFL